MGHEFLTKFLTLAVLYLFYLPIAISIIKGHDITQRQKQSQKIFLSLVTIILVTISLSYLVGIFSTWLMIVELVIGFFIIGFTMIAYARDLTNLSVRLRKRGGLWKWLTAQIPQPQAYIISGIALIFFNALLFVMLVMKI